MNPALAQLLRLVLLMGISHLLIESMAIWNWYANKRWPLNKDKHDDRFRLFLDRVASWIERFPDRKEPRV